MMREEKTQHIAFCEAQSHTEEPFSEEIRQLAEEDTRYILVNMNEL